MWRKMFKPTALVGMPGMRASSKHTVLREVECVRGSVVVGQVLQYVGNGCSLKPPMRCSVKRFCFFVDEQENPVVIEKNKALVNLNTIPGPLSPTKDEWFGLDVFDIPEEEWGGAMYMREDVDVSLRNKGLLSLTDAERGLISAFYSGKFPAWTTESEAKAFDALAAWMDEVHQRIKVMED